MVPRITLWFDRDEAGQQGTKKALNLLSQQKISVQSFNWQVKFQNKQGVKQITIDLDDPDKLSVKQLQFLRERHLI